MAARFLAGGLVLALVWCAAEWSSLSASGIAWRIIGAAFAASFAGKILGMLLYRSRSRFMSG